MGVLTASARDLQLMLLPCLLLGYYLAVWLLVARPPKRGVIVPQYTPPANISPAEIRYLLTGASDRKTVAAVLAHLAAHKVISLQPAARGYRITLLFDQPPAGLPVEEVSALDALAELASFSASASSKPALPRTLFLQPSSGKNLSLVASVVAGSLIKRMSSLYFRRNLRYSLPAVALSIVAALGAAAPLGSPNGAHGVGAVFMTLWFLLFSLIMGLIIATSVLPAMRDAFRGTLSRRNIARTFLPLPLFLGVPGLVALLIARASTAAFAWALAALVVVNIAGTMLIQTLTPLARQRMDQVEGFKQFLATVELDPLKRMNNPRLTPALLNDYLAYAIVLDLKEAWGDHLSDALFSTIASAG